MGRKVEITLPYEDDLELVLDSSSTGRHAMSVADAFEWLAEHWASDVPHERLSDEEVVRILTSTVALYTHGAGTLGQCFDTAVVWERG